MTEIMVNVTDENGVRLGSIPLAGYVAMGVGATIHIRRGGGRAVTRCLGNLEASVWQDEFNAGSYSLFATSEPVGRTPTKKRE